MSRTKEAIQLLEGNPLPARGTRSERSERAQSIMRPFAPLAVGKWVKLAQAILSN